MKYFSQTNETVIESEQMKLVIHGQVDLYLYGAWNYEIIYQKLNLFGLNQNVISALVCIYGEGGGA